ncbi:FecR domain-containing protein [Dysgonomonas sp. BGC7]|uniref:FecR domain-containing protein n=1 Tax=Dysgonomonas sp. BGC7 TaxID=1658008 RepID=UPI000682C96A|nr:FecR domain-containing protein [Dysgonomonas sp. BGC7]MBD8390176.1 FecR domain-containing protein [Dysgonomonas sp. BGC7]
MKNNYEEYTFDEFLSDDFFLESTYNPTPETEQFWSKLVDTGKIDADVFARARQFILELNESNKEVADFVDSRIPFLWERIDETIKEKKRKLYLRSAIAIASIAVVFILSVVFIKHGNSDMDNGLLTEEVDIRHIAKKSISDEIQLISSAGELSIPGDSAVVDYSQGENIVVNDKVVDKKSQKLEYIQLVVPYGKRSSVILSDGSQIWVNAGSRIVYPVSFAKDVREIYVDGEVYADIVSDKDHPFIVKTKEMDVKVLGTQFNVMAYENEKAHSVVLVKGSVEVENRTGKQETVLLKPNQLFYASAEHRRIENVDVLSYISWKSGYSLFKNERLGVILERLSRYYGISISCDVDIYDLRCSGGLDLKDNISQVLDGICQSVSVKYIKENNKYKFSVNP